MDKVSGYKHDNREEGIPFPGDYATVEEYYAAMKEMVDAMSIPSREPRQAMDMMLALFENYEQGIINIAPTPFAAERLLRPFMMARLLLNAERNRALSELYDEVNWHASLMSEGEFVNWFAGAVPEAKLEKLRDRKADE